tara:strand:- start:2668 stop:2883 length:216 start_codon:yes stop_codon:yes gene_type:complete
MKATKLLKGLDTKIDKLYDALYMVRDVFEDIEDGEVDELIESFIESVEMVISEGSNCVPVMRDRIAELLED